MFDEKKKWRRKDDGEQAYLNIVQFFRMDRSPSVTESSKSPCRKDSKRSVESTARNLQKSRLVSNEDSSSKNPAANQDRPSPNSPLDEIAEDEREAAPAGRRPF